MVLRFGPFELDADREELRRSGLVLRLPHQPARLLSMFVRRAGEVVTREEIRQELWGSDTHVDFEQGINAAIRQIRYHLGDNAEAPRYLKTIPRRGYVWIAPVETVEMMETMETVETVVAPPEARRERPRPKWRMAVAGAVILVIAIAAVAVWMAVPDGRRTIAVIPFRAMGALPAGVDPPTFTAELRSTIGTLPHQHLLLVDERSSGDAQVRIEGTMQREGDSVRVIVSGIDTASRTQLWTATYERRLGQHQNMAMQTAHLVAQEVGRRFLPRPRHEPLLRTQVSPHAREIYRQARLESRRMLPDPDGNRAAAMFEQALREEPRFAEALSGLADVWVQRTGTFQRAQRAAAVAQTRRYAARALALQPDNAEARSALGLLAFQWDWNLTAAEQAFREAARNDPEYVDAHFNLCVTLAARGEFDEALEVFEETRALDPVDFDLHPGEGTLYLRARRYEEAVAKYREVLRFHDSPPAQWGILWASAARGDWKEATSVLRPMLHLGPRPAGVPATEEEFRDLFRRLETVVLTSRDQGTLDDYHVAAYYSMRGDRELAFAALDRAFASHSVAVGYLLVDPRFDALRDDPRYAPLAARIR
jgi:DNA-binding winged helix-turn-helix (wHTH) protein/tetratricopeptide (TPR) repeat protein